MNYFPDCRRTTGVGWNDPAHAIWARVFTSAVFRERRPRSDQAFLIFLVFQTTSTPGFVDPAHAIWARVFTSAVLRERRPRSDQAFLIFPVFQTTSRPGFADPAHAIWARAFTSAVFRERRPHSVARARAIRRSSSDGPPTRAECARWNTGWPIRFPRGELRGYSAARRFAYARAPSRFTTSTTTYERGLGNE
jgi:hypothetical protein